MKPGASSDPYEEGEEADAADDSQKMDEDGNPAESDVSALDTDGEDVDLDDLEDDVKSVEPVSDAQSEAAEGDSGVESIDTSDEIATLSPDTADPAALAKEYVPDDYQHKGSDLEIKWALGRQNVRKSRDKQKMFLLQNSIDELEEEIVDKLTEDEEVSDVNITDVREAALILAYNQPEKLSELLDGWGARHV